MAKVSSIVGIGASAEGLEACGTFLEAVPADCGMAFVLVVQGDPRRESELVRALGKRSALDVSSAVDGARLRANSVCVVPADREPRIENGRLRLGVRARGREQDGAIDRFFASLARDQRQHAAALVLSGVGTDGTRGLGSIRRAGGLALAQEERRKARSGPPRSATAASVVGLVLPVEEMFAALREHVFEPLSGAARSVKRPTARPLSVVARLRQELTETREQLRAAMEQLGHSREELQSSNERLQTSNEELQTSNEELETSSEELRSSNEALAVVNAQLLEKVAELTRSSNDVANLLTSSDIATLLLDSELRVSRFTAAASSVFALQAGDVGRPIAELRMRVAYPRFLDDARAVAAGGAPVERQVRGGSDRVFIARLAPYRTQHGHIQGVVATFVDVTSLEVARTTLRENAEQLAALFEHVAVGIAITDLAGRIVDANPALCAMLGWERGDLVGRPFGRHVYAKGARAAQKLHDELVAGRRRHYDIEERYLRADASMLWVRVSVSLIQPGGGAAARAVHVIQDVSEAKRIEKQLRDQEGLARLGEMAAAIAHEVRSPLAAILGAVDVLATRIPSGADQQRVVGDIRQRIASVDALVGELLLFARPRELKFARIPLLRALQETATLLEVSGELGDVELTVRGEEVEVLGDMELLRSVFVNLATNAAQAMNGRGELRVELCPKDDSCAIVFSDTGPGIPEALAHRIFEPFFTTRSRGIGLGLWLAKRIIEAHGGDIALLPSQGHGATLSITLPRARD